MFKLNNILKSAVILTLSAFVSCVEIDDQQEDLVGYLAAPSLEVDVTMDDLVLTKSAPELPSVQKPDDESLAAGVTYVVREKGTETDLLGGKVWTEALSLPVGKTYVVEAYYGEKNGFGGVCFAGSQEILIEPMVTVTPKLTLGVANSLLCVTTDALDGHFNMTELEVMSGEMSHTLTTEAGVSVEDVWVWVPSGNTLSVTVKGTNSAGNETSFAYNDLTPSAGVAYNLVCGLPAEDQWPSISLTVSPDDVWASRIYITDPASFSGNISAENQAAVVYEAIPSSSSDWSSPAIAVSENGVLGIKGLTPGTEYQVRARVGALVSNVVKVTPSLDGFSAAAAHTFTGGELDGTDVTVTLSKSDVVKNAISNWTISLCKTDGTVLRSGLSLGTSDGSAITATDGWPYLPVGSYKLVAQATMTDGELHNMETAFSTVDPSFTVTPACKTTYDYYLAGDKSNANAESGSKTAQASEPNHSLYEIGSSVAISSNLMQNVNYSKSVYYAAKKDSEVVMEASYEYGTAKSHSVGDVHNSFTDWRAYVLKVTVNFAGTEITVPRDFHITGLPYSINFYDNVTPSDWDLNNNGSCYSRLVLKRGNAYALTPKFHIPDNINASSSLTAYAYRGSVGDYKPTVSIHASNSGINSTVNQTLSGTSQLPYTATYTSISSDYTLSTSVYRVCIYTSGEGSKWSVGSGDMGVVCQDFSAKYRL